jgi:transcriptional regulator with XRE-family HTH domain
MTPGVGRRVLSARERAGLSQEQLAARVGVARATIQNVEQERTQPRPSTLRRIAEALGIDFLVLTTGEAPAPSGRDIDEELEELRAIRDQLTARIERLEGHARRTG